MQRREYVHFDHQAHAAFRKLVESTQKRHGGVVDQNVWRTDPFDQLGEEPLSIVGLRQVGLDSHRRPTGGDDLFERLVQRALVFRIGFQGAGGEPDRGAFARQSLRDRLAQSAAGARHQSDLSGTASWQLLTRLLTRTSSPKRRMPLGYRSARHERMKFTWIKRVAPSPWSATWRAWQSTIGMV